MAIVGFSDVYAAKYNNADGDITYSGGMKLAKAVELDIQINTTDNNTFYADNEVAESVVQFADGTMTHTPDDLMPEESALIFGITPQEVPGETSVMELSYDDNTEPPYLGWGGVIKKVKNGSTRWRAVILPKVKYNIPNDAATTQGESINWQTPILTATIFRDESPKHRWKREATFDTLEKAVNYIKSALDIGVVGG